MATGYSQKELIKFNFESLNLDKNDFFGNSPPAVFVGRFGYPKVNVGILSPVEKKEDANLLDNPKEWAKQKLRDIDIIKLRSQLINSRFQSNIKSFDSRFLNLSQEVSMAYKPVDMEIQLKNKPKKVTELNRFTKPLSNNANLKNIKITENPKIKTAVDKTTSDWDLKAVQGINKLYNKGFDENFLHKILSIGLLGIRKNRKLVPTRWSITATDDTITKELLKEVKYNEPLETTLVYSGYYLGNIYLFIFMPGVWSYELFEMEVPFKTNPWSRTGNFYGYDYENYYGRKGYVDETAGGYFASRLPAVEKLKQLRKQASVLVLRFITEEDKFPLGVWVCREASRISLNSEPIEFEDIQLALNYAKAFAKNKFKEDIETILNESRTIRTVKEQPRLSKWL